MRSPVENAAKKFVSSPASQVCTDVLFGAECGYPFVDRAFVVVADHQVDPVDGGQILRSQPGRSIR